MGNDLSHGNDGVRIEGELVTRHGPKGKLAHNAVCLVTRHVGDAVERHGSVNLHDSEGDKRQLVRYSLPWSGARARTEVVERSLPDLQPPNRMEV